VRVASGSCIRAVTLAFLAEAFDTEVLKFGLGCQLLGSLSLGGLDCLLLNFTCLG